MAKSTTLAALAAGIIGASVLGAATTAQAQYYYYPNQPYYAPVQPDYGYAPPPRRRYGYGGPPAVYYDKDTAKAVARNWKEQQKARIKSGYYNQPQYYAPAPRQRYYQQGYQQGYVQQPRVAPVAPWVGRVAPHDRAPYYVEPQNHY